MSSEMSFLLQLGLILLIGGQFGEAAKDKLTLDDFFTSLDNKPVAEIATAICEPHDDSKMFVVFATVTRLVEFISQSTDPKMVECWTQYGDALSLAGKVVETSNDDICDDSKITLIEEFHHKYISKNRRHVHQQKISQYSAPLMLTTFFIHYAETVANNCRNELYAKLVDSTANDPIVGGLIEYRERVPFDDILDNFAKSFLFEVNSDNRKYIFLLWNLVEDLAFEAKNKLEFANYIDLEEDLQPGQRYRVTMKMDNAAFMQTLQDHCRQQLKPFYQNTVLSMIRLIDMGYFFFHLDTIPKRWYKATQFCETILPISFISDNTLTGGQMELVTKEEAKKITVDDDTSLEAPARQVPEMAGTKMTTDGMFWVVRRNSGDRSRAIIEERKKVVKSYVSKVNSKVAEMKKSEEGNIFLARKEIGAKEDASEVVGDSLAELARPSKAEARKEKVQKIAKHIYSDIKSGVKKVAHSVKAALTGLLRFVGSILLHISMLSDEARRQSGSVYVVTRDNGRMSAPMLAVPMIG